MLIIDGWSKYIQVHPLKNKNAGVIGTVLAEFLATIGHFEKVELAFDNEPIIAASRFATTMAWRHF